MCLFSICVSSNEEELFRSSIPLTYALSGPTARQQALKSMEVAGSRPGSSDGGKLAHLPVADAKSLAHLSSSILALEK